MPKTSLFLFLLLPWMAQAQSDPPLVAAGTLDNENYKWTFAIGDLAIQTLQIPGTLWSQGSVQPDLGIVGVSQSDLPEVQVLLYPNPTVELLYLQISAASADEPLNADVLDASGRMVYVHAGAISKRQITRISVASLPAATYFLRLSDSRGRCLTQAFQKL